MTFDTSSGPRKPRLALMGEFSAGKSTLANLLLGRQTSPVQVTATQLPPVWYTLGAGTAERMTKTGTREDLSLQDWTSVSPDDTHLISVAMEADFLHACDLIDMPGTSDPNMAPDFWEMFLPQVDFAIWCTPAAQAWRQSEAALWEQVPPELHRHSLLLVTRMDKLQSDRDRERVLTRVQREAGDVFAKVLPISLLSAIAGRENDAALRASGGAALVEHISHVLDTIKLLDKPDLLDSLSAHAPSPEVAAPMAEAEAPEPAAPTARVLPRRVVRSGNRPGGRSPRIVAE